jgi:hypothetical protein
MSDDASHERTENAPAPTDDEQIPVGRPQPAHEAHGGSMAPGLVDSTGRQITEPPQAAPEG